MNPLPGSRESSKLLFPNLITLFYIQVFLLAAHTSLVINYQQVESLFDLFLAEEASVFV